MSKEMKILISCGGAALLGLIFLIVGIVKNCSLESQLIAALGGGALGTVWIVLGIIFLIGGIGLFAWKFVLKK